MRPKSQSLRVYIPWLDYSQRYGAKLNDGYWKVLSSPHSKKVRVLKAPKNIGSVCLSQVYEYKLDKSGKLEMDESNRKLVVDQYATTPDLEGNCSNLEGFFVYRKDALTIDLSCIVFLINNNQLIRTEAVKKFEDRIGVGRLKVFGVGDMEAVVLSKKNKNISTFVVSYADSEASDVFVAVTVELNNETSKVIDVEVGVM